jgi:hypothetical protein
VCASEGSSSVLQRVPVLCFRGLRLCASEGSGCVLQRAPVVNSTFFRELSSVLHQDHGQRVAMLGANRAGFCPHQHVSKTWQLETSKTI